jgi:hypothetical protein
MILNSMKSRLFAFIAPMIAFSSQAFAMDPAAPPEGPVPVVAAPVAAAPIEPKDESRARFGLSLNGGSFFPGPFTIALGAEARLGYQLNNDVGVYGQLGGTAGLGAGTSTDGASATASVSAVTYWYLGANIESLLGESFFVAGGAAIGRGGWGVLSGTVAASSSRAASGSTVVAGGLMPQFNARIGFAPGKRALDGTKRGLSFAFDLRALLAPNSERNEVVVGANGASTNQRTSTFAVGFAPMLMIGFDTR